MHPLSSQSVKSRPSVRTTRQHDRAEILSQEDFRLMVSLERKRSLRTQRPFVLLQIDTKELLPAASNGRTLLKVLSTLQPVTRDTDEIGWYELNTSIGVMFREVEADNDLIISTILSRIHATLRDGLQGDEFGEIRFSCHLFPEEWERRGPTSEADGNLALALGAGGSSSGRGRLPS
jgi:hypothetical protein